MSGGAGFILHILFAVSVYLESKESCMRKGFVRRNTFKLGLVTSAFFSRFLIIFGQRYAAL